MTRTALTCLVLAAVGPSASADFNPFLDGVPATYTPGTSFDFTVHAGELRRLGIYSVQLDFQTVPPSAGLFSASGSPPADPALYPFPTSENFSSNGVANGNVYSLTISDFIFSPPQGASTRPYENDTLAVVTVTPGLGLTGPIRLSVNLDATSFLTTDGGYVPFTPSSDEIVINQADGDTGAVPAPAGVVLAAAAFAGLAGRRLIRRRS